MALNQDFADALQATDPLRAMRAVLADRLAAGQTRDYLVEELTREMLAFRTQGMDNEEDLLLEALDILAGFVSPHLQV